MYRVLRVAAAIPQEAAVVAAVAIPAVAVAAVAAIPVEAVVAVAVIPVEAVVAVAVIPVVAVAPVAEVEQPLVDKHNSIRNKVAKRSPYFITHAYTRRDVY